MSFYLYQLWMNQFTLWGLHGQSAGSHWMNQFTLWGLHGQSAGSQIPGSTDMPGPHPPKIYTNYTLPQTDMSHAHPIEPGVQPHKQNIGQV